MIIIRKRKCRPRTTHSMKISWPCAQRKVVGEQEECGKWRNTVKDVIVLIKTPPLCPPSSSLRVPNSWYYYHCPAVLGKSFPRPLTNLEVHGTCPGVIGLMIITTTLLNCPVRWVHLYRVTVQQGNDGNNMPRGWEALLEALQWTKRKTTEWQTFVVAYLRKLLTDKPPQAIHFLFQGLGFRMSCIGNLNLQFAPLRSTSLPRDNTNDDQRAASVVSDVNAVSLLNRRPWTPQHYVQTFIQWGVVHWE